MEGIYVTHITPTVSHTSTEKLILNLHFEKTDLKPFILHVGGTENVINVIFGHGLQELTHLLLSLERPGSGRYDRMTCNQAQIVVC